MPGRRELLAAELAAADLEDELAAYKADEDRPNQGPDYEDVKQRLREARRAFRLLREGAPPEDSVGDATVRPEPVKASAKAKSPGGGGA